MIWAVYGLVDPRTAKVFYVGCTSKLKQRITAHHCDPASAAYWRCHDLRAVGLRAECIIFATAETKIAVKVVEARLILSIPDLVNSKKPCGMAQDFGWTDLRSEIAPMGPNPYMRQTQ